MFIVDRKYLKEYGTDQTRQRSAVQNKSVSESCMSDSDELNI